MSMVTTTFLKLPRMRVIPKIMVSLTHRYLLQIGLQQPSNQVFNHQPPLKFLIKTLITMKKLTPQKSSSGTSYSNKKKLTPQKSSSSKIISSKKEKLTPRKSSSGKSYSKKKKLTPQKSSSGTSYSKKKKLTPQKSSLSKSILLRRRS